MQERIADKIGKTQPYVAYQLRFGAFLNFTTTCCKNQNPPKNLTEGRFRALWEQTEASGKNAEDERFRQVIAILDQCTPMRPKTPGRSDAIIEAFAGKGWFTPQSAVASTRIHGTASPSPDFSGGFGL